MPDPLLLAGLALVAGMLGTLGGLGGAVLLVPALLLLDVAPEVAAPLGAVSVAAASVAASPSQLRSGLVHHRLGVTVECAASAGAVAGAVIGGLLAPAVATRILAAIALGAALLALRRGGLYNPPDPLFASETPGEWPGTLGGSYRLGQAVVPYQARRVPAGLVGMVGAGVVAGIGGVGGGFLKVPLLREVMRVPLKVAAATSTFTVGITASVSLIVFARQGRVETDAASAVVLGALVGGLIGARLGGHLDPGRVRTVLGVLLVAVAVVLGVRG